MSRVIIATYFLPPPSNSLPPGEGEHRIPSPSTGEGLGEDEIWLLLAASVAKYLNGNAGGVVLLFHSGNCKCKLLDLRCWELGI